ncbi:hypothetical protein [Spirosoma terrae]|uniref:Uncharacterized protein n=1 Tax=Spirosoma terrae TaxID=1968276 RepID=A0A6L9L8H8_9BACT|nr:hypothetical protein [Spirosoma terrae]NDU96864.1 hypothetical protein [Spirosoma terrae]
MEAKVTNAPLFDDHKVSVSLSEIKLLISSAEESLQKDPNNATLMLYLTFLRNWEHLPRDPERDHANLHKVSYAEYMLTMLKGATAGAVHAGVHTAFEVLFL